MLQTANPLSYSSYTYCVLYHSQTLISADSVHLRVSYDPPYKLIISLGYSFWRQSFVFCEAGTKFYRYKI
jgi:hypothetical protein